jgi:hypothetical protein
VRRSRTAERSLSPMSIRNYPSPITYHPSPAFPDVAEDEEGYGGDGEVL